MIFSLFISVIFRKVLSLRQLEPEGEDLWSQRAGPFFLPCALACAPDLVLLLGLLQTFLCRGQSGLPVSMTLLGQDRLSKILPGRISCVQCGIHQVTLCTSKGGSQRLTVTDL